MRWIWTLNHLREKEVPMTCINGKLVPARPENFKKKMLSIWERIQIAWEVFQCRAEAFRWPEGQ